jgi:CYTH domain-containing protein
MALEIERRFLVSGSGWRRHIRWQAQLQQGYLLAAADGLTVRVRSSGEQAWLTLKAVPAGGAAGLARLEFEYSIPPADAEQLLALATARLAKRRYGLDLPGGDWVVDVFEAENAPLVVAEVELASADAPLQPPAWCLRELTGRHDLSNAALARCPLANWPADQRQQLLVGVEDVDFTNPKKS